MKLSKRALMSAAALIALSAPMWSVAQAQNQQTAQAQSAQAGGVLEEIVVTAQRREESLQTIPVAVSAFTSAELDRRQVTKTIDLIRFVPNMIGANNTGPATANTYSIRALNNTEAIATFDPPVGSYVDDIYISRQILNNFNFFDVERVEILRGPQGTLFGRNTTGGAVNVIIRKPGDELGGFAEVGYGRYNKITTRASIDVPFSDKVLTKFSGFYVDDKGYVKNRTTGDRLNDENSKGLRGALRGLLSDTVTWDFSAEWIDSSYANILNSYDPATGDRVSLTGLRKGVAQFRNVTTGPKREYTLGNNADSLALASNFTIDVGDSGAINFISGFRQTNHKFLLPFFNSPLPTDLFSLANEGDHDQFTQEIKYNGSLMDGKIDLVAGLFYLYEDNLADFADIFAGGISADRTLKNTAEAAAGYVQADFNASDALTITAGIRYTDEGKKFTVETNPGTPLTCADPTNLTTCAAFGTRQIVAAGIPTSLKSKVWTPRFALEYKASDDILLYASATRGFKSGGWNARGTRAFEFLPFDPEVVWSYEGGFKSDLLDNTLRFNVNAFYMDVTDFQLPASFVRPNGTVAFITRNFADLQNYGVETEVTWVPVDGLNLFVAGGMQEADYANLNPSIAAQAAACNALLAIPVATRPSTAGICNAGIVTTTGTLAEPVRAPDYTVTFGGNYAIPVGNDFVVSPSASIRRVGRSPNSSSNFPAGIQPGFWQVNSGITFGDVDDTWELAAECENCFGERFITAFFVGAYIDEPSRWAVRLRYNF
ncbi:MAG: TonB-dependent receptor [Rhodospirillaceae bacterium]|nr:TonB-dependent receptor [Rhodospirillaceae bacterium]